MTPSRPLVDMAEGLAGIERELGVLDDPDAALRAVTALAVDRVAGCEYAGITRGSEGSFSSVAETDERVCRVDRIQYELGSGPCIDALVDQSTFHATDLRTDRRWPEFGRRAAASAGVVSMLSLRLFVEDQHEIIVALNMYARTPGAFTEQSEVTGTLLATAGALAVSGAAARARANNLLAALDNAREIGIAIGVLMNQQKITREQALNLLRITSQAEHRKLADIASDVAETGVLPDRLRS